MDGGKQETVEDATRGIEFYLNMAEANGYYGNLVGDIMELLTKTKKRRDTLELLGYSKSHERN